MEELTLEMLMLVGSTSAVRSLGHQNYGQTVAKKHRSMDVEVIAYQSENVFSIAAAFVGSDNIFQEVHQSP